MISWHCLNSPKVTLLSNSNFLNDEQNYGVFFFIRHHVYHQKEFSKHIQHSWSMVDSKGSIVNSYKYICARLKYSRKHTNSKTWRGSMMDKRS